MAFLLLTECIVAQTVIRPTDNRSPEASLFYFKSEEQSGKISPSLLEIQKNFNDGSPIQSNEVMTVANGRILVEAIATSPEQAQSLLQQLTSLGMTQGVAYQKVVNGLLPIGQISQAGTLNSLLHLNYVPTPVANVGAVTSQGRQSLQVDQLAAKYGVDGAPA